MNSEFQSNCSVTFSASQNRSFKTFMPGTDAQLVSGVITARTVGSEILPGSGSFVYFLGGDLFVGDHIHFVTVSFHSEILSSSFSLS